MHACMIKQPPVHNSQIPAPSVSCFSSFPLLPLSLYVCLLLHPMIQLLYFTIHYYTILMDPAPTNHSNPASVHHTCCHQLLFLSTPPKAQNHVKYLICRQNLLHMVCHNRDIQKEKKKSANHVHAMQEHSQTSQKTSLKFHQLLNSSNEAGLSPATITHNFVT